MLNIKNTFMLAALSLAAISSASARDFVLDDFNYIDTTTGEAVSVFLEVDGDTIDGIRVPSAAISNLTTVSGGIASYNLDLDETIRVDADDGDQGSTANVETRVDPSLVPPTNILTFSEASLIDAELKISYSNADFSPLDLSDFSRFYFDVLEADIGFNLDLTLTDDFGIVETSSFVLDIDDAIVRDDNARINFNFSDFSSVDFSAVTFITAIIDSDGVSADLVLNEVGVTAVPEPTSLAILGLALLGFTLRRRTS